MWNKRPQPKSQVTRDELKSYLIDNQYTPIFVVSKANVITMRLEYDGTCFLGHNYIQLDEKGEAPLVKIAPENYSLLFKRLTDDFSLYTVQGMKVALDHLDRISPIS